jgi:hypothetical protein
MSLFAKPALPLLPPLPPKAHTIRLSAFYHKDEAAAQAAAAAAAAAAARKVVDDNAADAERLEQDFGLDVEDEEDEEDEEDRSSKPLARVDLAYDWRTTSQLLWDVDVPIPYSVQRTASMIIDKLSTSEQFLLKIAACVCVGVGEGCVHFTKACVRACHPFPAHVEILDQGMNFFTFVCTMFLCVSDFLIFPFG